MTRAIIDGNEAAADVAYRLTELCSIYPITPSSSMAELADDWSAAGRENVWGTTPAVIEMQSEGGAAGAMHGALQGGALCTTFTASQGLLLMIPNMYKIAGELTSTVIHVAARALAAQGLSIFGDHQDVMAARQTGWAMLASCSVQEAHDMALVSHMATMRSRVPFLHFFDGFRTSHELNVVEKISDDDLRALVPRSLVLDHRRRALTPAAPQIRGTAQNPDTYFQSRETVNPYYTATPGIVQEAMDALGERVGRHYSLVEYTGAPDADRVLVIMGSGAETAAQTAAYLTDKGEKVGVVNVRLYRPFPTEEVLAAVPASATRIAVMDRTKEPGALGDPLYLDVTSALSEAVARGLRTGLPMVVGGRYGLSSKEFTPEMVRAVFDELAAEGGPRPRFTVGVNDDVTHLSLPVGETLVIEPEGTHTALFYGLGSDGTVGANKNTIKILGADEDRYAQGYFVYDSKKSGSRTTSHLRFGPRPIQAPYLLGNAGFIGCHHMMILERVDVLGPARHGATFLVNAPFAPAEVWENLPAPVQQQIREKDINLYAIDATAVARGVSLGNRTNTVLQACFFAISGVLPKDVAIERIKESIRATYGRRGATVVEKNELAVDAALENLHAIPVPADATPGRPMVPPVPATAPEFVRTVTAEMVADRGGALPVSMLPVDGTYPTGTAAYEKRNISEIVAEWDPESCIQCGNCAFVCPHAVIRSKYYPPGALDGAPDDFRHAPLNAAGLPGGQYTLQVYAEDCTGCGLCVEACPVKPVGGPDRRAINLSPARERHETEKRNVAFFESIPVNDRSHVDFGTVRGTQFLEPLFEFSGACAGCGETPYLKLLTQLFGDRALVANATGCSSIYGGNLPTTPWTKNSVGRGPAWSNSLFEDNAEFGLGMRLAADVQTGIAEETLDGMRAQLGDAVVDDILGAPQLHESQLEAQLARVAALNEVLEGMDSPEAELLRSVSDFLVRRSVWIVGGDGWAYDIGSGGLDHVLSTGRDVNILVMDTEVYSNTGGQSSKSTPLGAVAKFAAGGKMTGKKDIALQATAYGGVYVARIAMGADPQQTLKAFREAEAFDGPSLIIAYSHCIAHGIDIRKGLDQQYKAVNSGHFPLMRYNPVIRADGGNPFLLDSPRPRLPLADYRKSELRFRLLRATNPEQADRLDEMGQAQVLRRWAEYESYATSGAEAFTPDTRKE